MGSRTRTRRLPGGGRVTVIDRDLGFAQFVSNMGVVADASRTREGIGVSVGIPDNADPYPDGTPVVTVAATNEYGSPARGIPARPFLGPTSDRKGREWQDDIGKVAIAATSPTTRNPKNVLRAGLKTVGAQAVADVAATIEGMTSPPNAPSTIEKKGKDDPLVDTGRMVGSLRAQVRGV